MKNYAIENETLKHPQSLLISSFKLENGTIITPLLNFYLEIGLQCTKIYRFVQNTPRKCFNNFVQYGKLRMLELYCNFFDKFCDVNKFEELEMDTDSLYLALAEENLCDCIQPDKRAAWEK